MFLSGVCSTLHAQHDGISGSGSGPGSQRRRHVWVAWTLAALFFLTALIGYTRNNDFAFYYHPDESGKTKQIVEGGRNMRHPLLMLTVTEQVMEVAEVFGVKRTHQNAVILGRWVIAFFAAATVSIFVLLAFELYGLGAALLAGLAVISDRYLFELSHYMKEDPALVVGLALTVLAVQFYVKKRTLARIAWVGAAAAVAFSGKYVGIAALVLVTPIVLFSTSDGPPAKIGKRAIYFFAAFVVALLLMNYRWISGSGFETLLKGLTREVNIATTGHQGLPIETPHPYYWKRLVDLPWPILTFAGIYAAWVLATIRKRSPAEWLLLALPVLFFISFSYAPKASSRYFLPISVFVYGASALGVGAVCAVLFKRRLIPSLVACCVCAAFLIPISLETLRPFYEAYQFDDRKILVRWIEDNVPADETIAQDARVNIPYAGRSEFEELEHVPHKILGEEFVPDLGTLSELRDELGVDYVAVCSGTYERFFKSDRKPLPEVEDLYEKRKAFYSELFEKHKLIWESEKGRVLYVQPGIRLYDIRGTD